MRITLIAAFIWFQALPVWADARVTVLIDALRLDEVLTILRDEGLAYGAELDEDMLDGQGGPFFAAQLDRIYDTQRIKETVRRAIDEGMADDEIEASIAFFSSRVGAQIISLENAARLAISNTVVEEAARERYEELADTDDPLMAWVADYISVNDLLERNVASAMGANFQFYKGLSDGGFLKRPEADILAEVWSQQEDITDDTESWLGAYLLMAYDPLPDDAMDDYLNYTISAAGTALNSALFDGFEKVYSNISYTMGRAISLVAQGDEI